MDQMDIDHIADVPDTPDRLTGQNVNGKSIMDRRSNASMSSFLGNHNLLDGASKTLFKVNDDKKMARIQSSDMKDLSSHIGARKKTLLCGAPGNSGAEEARKRVASMNRPFSLPSNASSPMPSHFANKGKEVEKSDSGLGQGNMVSSVNDSHHKVGNGRIAPTSLTLNSIQRVSSQKRLVRNGCISPNNIARARESVGKEKMEHDVQLNPAYPMTSSSPLNNSRGKEWMSNDLESLKSKGKGIMQTPFKIKEQEVQSAHPPTRNSVSINEIVKENAEIDGESFRSTEELVGWRSTRNRSKLQILPSSRENWQNPSESGVYLFNGSPTNMARTGETERGGGISDNHSMELNTTSTQNASLPPGSQRVSHRRPDLGRFIGHRPAANELTKRHKQRFKSSRNGECSRATLDSPDVVFIGSSGNAGRTNETRSRNHLDSLVPVIEIDETSPGARGDGSSNQGSNADDASAMAEQIEADEILARELQEQLYNEVPSVGVGEMDAHLAMALQQGSDSSPIFSRRRNGPNVRRSSGASSSTQPHSSSSPILSRRGYQSRAPTVNRMARLRNRFPGRPRTISSIRERGSLFPAEMDVDLRMHILEALEAINDMGVDNSLLRTHRDFNENDYEMLLALDENNHQHGGASVSQINGLPQSTVQRENFEEACAICLDTPTLGDTIRHLPCLHKFHKDCIDPWLRRKTSCPVCKSSIT